MKPLPLLLCMFLTALVTGVTVVLVLPERSDPGSVIGRGNGGDLAQLERDLAAQGELLRELADRLDVRSPKASVRTPVNDLESMVRKVLAEELGQLGDGAPRAGEEGDEFRVDDAVADILNMRAAGASYAELEAYWRKLREEGRTDELVEAFEEYAAANPADPEAQVLLGSAYIQRLQEAPTGPEMGEWAMKADGAFDVALELEESNWEARFSKAVALSFWPPIFGKQGDSIGQFEILLEQQKNSPPESDHAQTYMYLGNLYQQQGNTEKAKQIWQEGLAAFPEDEALAEKYGGTSAN